MQLTNAGRELSLKSLQSGSGCPLLLLHELYGSAEDWSASEAFDVCSHWAGPVYALDFAGHGASQSLKGGWYSPEGCVADADLALSELGSTAIAGTGLGAYVGLLLSGARAKEVLGTLLLPGLGLAGAGPAPNDGDYRDAWGGDLPTDLPPGVDPMSCCLDRDPRPRDYACAFGEAAAGVFLHEDGTPRPPWWEAVRDSARATQVVAHASDWVVGFDALATHTNR